MKSVVANYDEEKVYASDIKKLLKWYQLLDNHKLISVIEEGANKEETATETASEEVAEKPKKKAAKKTEATEEASTEEAPKKKKVAKKAE
jgi:hypothetical protein